MSEALPTAGHPASVANSEVPSSPSEATYGREFWLIFAVTFVLNLVMNLLVLYPLYIVKLGGGASSIGAIIGTGSLAALLSRPGASSAITRCGRRWTAAWGLLLNGVAMMLLIPLKSIGWAIYAVTAIAGVANGAARVALFAMVFDILPAGRQGETMSIFSLSGMGPATFAALAGEAILKLWGFTAFFAIAAALSVVSAATVMMVRDDRPARQSRAAQATATVDSVAGYPALLADPALLLFWIVTLLFGLALSTRNSFVAPFG
ncbi:MAG: MFS transporter, partial [Candidatus Binataceae bacterium]